MVRPVLRVILAVMMAAGAAAACSDDANPGSAAGEPPIITAGRRVYEASCVACHGEHGEGGVGRQLDAVTVTFPDCEDHVAWVRLGSFAWENQVGPTYGAQAREIGGAMPGFDGILTDDEIRLAVAYQRAAFGGESEADAATGCGAALDVPSG